MESSITPVANDLNSLTWKLFDEDSHQPRLVFSGDWAVSPERQVDTAKLIDRVRELRFTGTLLIQESGLGRWDTLLLATLLEIRAVASSARFELDVSAMPEGVQSLFALATAVPASPDAHHAPEPAGYLASVGDLATRFWVDAQYFNRFLGEAAISVMASSEEVLVIGRWISGFRSKSVVLRRSPSSR